ncbi:hypothetical protein BDW02DRAFT_136897 [Decorospora gaudefroyi]|uniref:Uncharacterized protein n=1 Tax=Decorospora gaudefroyi TaxID=184978 RepID=A0A6A5K5C4_9PLEO|nr:hypothetical protein BDW02DRAFT_136897 [Decorospora gaudefroyi]
MGFIEGVICSPALLGPKKAINSCGISGPCPLPSGSYVHGKGLQAAGSVVAAALAVSILSLALASRHSTSNLYSFFGCLKNA